MRKQADGIDIFELKWQQYEVVSKKVNGYFYDSSFVFIQDKSPNESLSDFLLKAKDLGHWTFPKYFLNGDDFTFWYNLNIFRKRILDTPGHYFNTLAWLHHNSKQTGQIEFQIRRMLGEVFTWNDMVDLGLNDQYSRKHLEEENTSVQLYCCCICASRGCGCFPIEIRHEGNYMVWHFMGELIRDFRFDYEQYKNQFNEYRTFVHEHGLIWIGD